MVNDQYKIGKDLSKKILFLGVSKKTKGGMSAVLVSYSKYIEGMQFIPTWKLGNKFVMHYRRWLGYGVNVYLIRILRLFISMVRLMLLFIAVRYLLNKQNVFVRK